MPPQKARTVNDVGLTLEDRLYQNGVFRRVVLQVRVLDDHDFTAGGSDARAQCSALSAVHLMEHQTVDAPCRQKVFLQLLAGAIVRTVVHHDDLLIGVWRSSDSVNEAV